MSVKQEVDSGWVTVSEGSDEHWLATILMDAALEEHSDKHGMTPHRVMSREVKINDTPSGYRLFNIQCVVDTYSTPLTGTFGIYPPKGKLLPDSFMLWRGQYTWGKFAVNSADSVRLLPPPR